MKDIFSTVGKILGWIFAAMVIGFTSLLTWLLAQRIIPGETVLDYVLQIMTLILFDGAAIVWFVTFLTVAKGTTQWALAGIGFIVGLLGAIIMAGGELVLGQALVQIDDPTRISWLLIATVVIAALIHATLVYLFHFADPGTKNRIENAQKVSKAIEQAYADARGEIDRQVDSLVAGLVASVVEEARQQINAATSLHIRRAGQLAAKNKTPPIIEGKARDVEVEETTIPRRRWRDIFSPRPGRSVTYASEAHTDNGADPTQPPTS